MKIPLDMPIILEPRFPQPNFSTNIFLQARKYYNLQLRSSNNMPCYTSDIREGSKVKMGGGGGWGGGGGGTGAGARLRDTFLFPAFW